MAPEPQHKQSGWTLYSWSGSIDMSSAGILLPSPSSTTTFHGLWKHPAFLEYCTTSLNLAVMHHKALNNAEMWGLYPPPRNPYGLQWTPLDSSGPLARPDWLVQCPVQSSPVHWTHTGLQATFQSPVPVQWTLSTVRVQWSPVESSVLLIINYKYYKKSEIRRLTFTL